MSRLVLAVLAIALVVSVSMMHRHQQIPQLVEISTKLRLWRGVGYSSGSFKDVTFTLVRVAGSGVDNVSLSQESDLASTAYWRLLIVANESTSATVKWEHEILPGPGKAGIYEGVVSTSMYLKGTFTVWVLLLSIRNNTTVFISSFSQRIRTY